MRIRRAACCSAQCRSAARRAGAAQAPHLGGSNRQWLRRPVWPIRGGARLVGIATGSPSAKARNPHTTRHARRKLLRFSAACSPRRATQAKRGRHAKTARRRVTLHGPGSSICPAAVRCCRCSSVHAAAPPSSGVTQGGVGVAAQRRRICCKRCLVHTPALRQQPAGCRASAIIHSAAGCGSTAARGSSRVLRPAARQAQQRSCVCLATTPAAASPARAHLSTGCGRRAHAGPPVAARHAAAAQLRLDTAAALHIGAPVGFAARCAPRALAGALRA